MKYHVGYYSTISTAGTVTAFFSKAQFMGSKDAHDFATMKNTQMEKAQDNTRFVVLELVE